MEHKPIKRREELVILSREHHEGLLLCWKIRTGLSNNVTEDRIIAYTIYFYNTFLKEHFAEEEMYVFTLLPENDAMVVKAIEDHDIINGMIKTLDSVRNKKEWLETFAYELEQHIRYEERQLFGYIEQQAEKTALEETGKKLANPQNAHVKQSWTDIFWDEKK